MAFVLFQNLYLSPSLGTSPSSTLCAPTASSPAAATSCWRRPGSRRRSAPCRRPSCGTPGKNTGVFRIVRKFWGFFAFDSYRDGRVPSVNMHALKWRSSVSQRLIAVVLSLQYCSCHFKIICNYFLREISDHWFFLSSDLPLAPGAKQHREMVTRKRFQSSASRSGLIRG